MTKLGDVAHYVNERINTQSLNPTEYISTDNMMPNKGGLEASSSLPEATSVTRFKTGDVLISNIRPYFKKIWYATTTSGCSNDVLVFRTNDSTKYASLFLYYVLSQDSFFDYMMAGANGTKMPRGNKKAILDFEVPSIQYNKQLKIAQILSIYDCLIDNSKKQIKLLEEAAQRIYKEWFVDLRFPGHEHTKIVDGIPEGWEKKEVGEIIGKIKRTTQIQTSDYKQEGKIPVIDQSRDYIAGYTDDETAIIDEEDAMVVFGDHTRILKYIPFPFAKGADGTQIIVSVEERMPQTLFYWSLLNINLSNYHYARHFKYLKESKVLVPSVYVAKKFNSIIHPIMDKIQIMREVIYKSSKARDLLLPKLMNGEIEV